MTKPLRIPRKFRHEYALVQQGLQVIAGVDEAGRGPLAGPVVAGAVIFPSSWVLSGLPKKLKGLNDSKQLTHQEREIFYQEISTRDDVLWGVGIVEVELIDRINILQATHRAMNIALAELKVKPEHVLVDGLPVKSITFPQTALVDGDALSFSIAAASVVAKVTRDRLMVQYHQQFPMYGFADHKGYATPEHYAAIKLHGPCSIHRQSFAPFRPVQMDLLQSPAAE
jgi:ribonuclease HII